MHRAGLIERPTRGFSDPTFILLRKELKKSLVQNLSTIAVENGKEIGCAFSFVDRPSGSIRIGCRNFLRAEGRRLRRWALRNI